MSASAPDSINVGMLARVEGEGGLHLKFKDGEVTEARLRIFEPPRFFEAFLRGRKFTEAPDITARICGICPIAYLTSASHAVEQICGVEVDKRIRELRRLIYFGEWVESHALHVYMLHAPDFLGYEDAIQMAADHPEAVERGLRLKKLGNDIMIKLGGREIHPINLRVGGFYKAPEKRDLQACVEEIEWARQAAIDTVRLTAGFEFPDYENDYEFVALSRPDEYAIIDGRLKSNKGIDIDLGEYDETFFEEHVEHSTSLHSRTRDGTPYHVGPLARYAVNFDMLCPTAQELALEAGLGKECFNPYKSIIVRSVEMVHACEEMLKIIEAYEKPSAPAAEVAPREGTGYGCTEAPRGICYHRYSIDGEGDITDAKIVAPTSQNQPTIEADLKAFATKYIDLPEDKLQWQCEQMIRNYDPCISCSCHFLKLTLEEEA